MSLHDHDVTPRRDIIKWILDRLLAHDDSITQELILTVEREARAEFGGQRIDYIPKMPASDRAAGRRPLDPEARRAAFEAGTSSAPTPQVLQTTGVSRATLYRLLKRGPGEGSGA